MYTSYKHSARAAIYTHSWPGAIISTVRLMVCLQLLLVYHVGSRKRYNGHIPYMSVPEAPALYRVAHEGHQREACLWLMWCGFRSSSYRLLFAFYCHLRGTTRESTLLPNLPHPAANRRLHCAKLTCVLFLAAAGPPISIRRIRTPRHVAPGTKCRFQQH